MIGYDKRILEIGTACGDITRALKDHRNTVIGIEIDKESGSIAQQYCEKMIFGDVELLNLDESLQNASFDIILLADVLEHLKSPFDLLKKLKKFLKPQGYMVVSIPNICHGDVLFNLMNSDFHYTSTGLLDRSHLRFFGIKNIICLFHENGFQIYDLKTTNVAIGWTEQNIYDTNNLGILRKFLENIPYTSVYQFIFKAMPSVEVKKIQIAEFDANDLFLRFIDNHFYTTISRRSAEKRHQIFDLGSQVSQNFFILLYRLASLLTNKNFSTQNYPKTYCTSLFNRIFCWFKIHFPKILKMKSELIFSDNSRITAFSSDSKNPLNANSLTLFDKNSDKLPTVAEQDVYAAYRPVDANIEYENEKIVNISISDIRLIAFYLPQFHPFPENDLFWGKGFTEWTNTTKALPFFPGHYQPRLPGELGFYDTRLKEVIKRQIELAKTHGIFGFCLYHYWFQGKPVMRVPFLQLIENDDLDIPFCLCWANEPWTARFDGLSTHGNVLIPQIHSLEDDIAFFRDIEIALKDRRYIHIDGKPLLIIYRPFLFPDIKKTLDLWRDLAKNAGIGDLFLVLIQNTFDEIVDPRSIGFDAAIELPPQKILLQDIKTKIALYDPNFQGVIYDYSELITKSLHREKPEYILFRGICPGWDCTPRRKNPVIIIGSAPYEYQRWLEGLCQYSQENLPSEYRYIFINAWNEWTEGAYLEPDRKFGYGYLNATARSLKNTNLKIAVVLHLYYKELGDEIIEYLHHIPIPFDLFISCTVHEKSVIESKFKKEFKDSSIEVKGVKNVGFDIAPFLIEFKYIFHEYDLVLKIHGKKSVHWSDNNIWRRHLMLNLLGSEHVVRAIFNSFTENPELGIIFPEHLPKLEKYINWGNNFPIASELFEIMNITIRENTPLEFPAGSMYWFRPKSLEPLFNLNINYSDFDDENKRDGTLAHAIERSILFTVNETGYTWQKVSYYDDKLNLSQLWNHLRTKKFGKIAVVIHIFYPDLVDEFIVYLKNIPYTFDILISTPLKYVNTIESQFRQHFPGSVIDIRAVENFGYDIYPFIIVFKDEIKKYDYVCKIHSKKSEHHPIFSGWRVYLLDNLLGSQYIVTQILLKLSENPKLGFIFPLNYPPVNNYIEWGSNFEIAYDLMKKINITLNREDPLVFPAGSMFWFKPMALEPLFRMPFTAKQFKEEGHERIDGTLSHAIERVILKIVERQNYTWEAIHAVNDSNFFGD